MGRFRCFRLLINGYAERRGADSSGGGQSGWRITSPGKPWQTLLVVQQFAVIDGSIRSLQVSGALLTDF
jgi:hypothetical protein